MRLVLSLSLACSLFIASAVHAAVSVVNLDSVTHVLIVNNGGEVTKVTLEPHQVYRTYGPMVDLQIKGSTRVIRANVFGEYAIWGDGKLVLQRIRHNQND